VCERKGERERAHETERKGWAGGGKERERERQRCRESGGRDTSYACVLVIYTRVQIQMKPKSQFEFVPRDTTKSEFLDLVDFRDASFFQCTLPYACAGDVYIYKREYERQRV